MVELLLVVFLMAVVVRLIEERLDKRQARLDNAFRRAQYVAVSGIRR